VSGWVSASLPEHDLAPRCRAPSGWPELDHALASLGHAAAHDAGRRRGGGEQVAAGVAEVAGQERDGAAAVHDPAGTDQPARPRGAQEVDLQLQRGCELARLERGDEGWAHRVVEHRREEAALDVAHRVAERGPGVEGDPDRAGGRIDLLDRPAERLGRRRPGTRPAIASQNGPVRPAATVSMSMRMS
jgi:hypothetical protein